MPTLNRRSFLAATAAVLAKPAVVLAADSDVDVVVVGAGAAGIAAARRLAAAKVRYALIEAAGQVGGRCVTDAKTFGVPFDRGAHWIHNSDVNPLAKLAAGLDIYAAPRGQTVRVGPRNARDSELENFLVGLVRSRRAIIEAGHGKTISRRSGRCRKISATGARPSNSCSGPTPAASRLHKSRPWIFPACRTATATGSAGKVTARCWRNSPTA